MIFAALAALTVAAFGLHIAVRWLCEARAEVRALRAVLDLMGRKAWEPSTYRTYARDAFEASHRRLP